MSSRRLFVMLWTCVLVPACWPPWGEDEGGGGDSTDAAGAPDASGGPDVGGKPDAAGDAAPDSPALAHPPEGLVHGIDRKERDLTLPAVQPSTIDPPRACAGQSVRLKAPAGQTFPAEEGDHRVLFAPCGIPGDVTAWSPDVIEVVVPPEAETGPVWIAGGVDGSIDGELERGRACVASLRDGSVVPDRPEIRCQQDVGDPFDPRARTRLRGIPTRDGEGQVPVPLHRARERKEDEPPACTVVEPARRAGLSFGAELPEGLFLSAGRADRFTCFLGCSEIAVGDGVPRNLLEVGHAPRVERFLPEVGTLRRRDTHRVERGMVHVAWRVAPGGDDTVLTLERDDDGPAPVDLEGGLDLEALTATQFTLGGRNACGEMSRTLTLEPITSLRLEPARIDLEDESEVRVVIDVPLDEDLPVALDDTSGGALALDPPIPVIPAGETSVAVRVLRNPETPPVPTGAHIGQIAARIADLLNPHANLVLDSYDPTNVHLLRGGPAPPPSDAHVLVQGRLRYRECISEDDVMPSAPPGRTYTLDAERCLLDNGMPVFKPVRRARVEIWNQEPVIDEQVMVLQTDDDGDFFGYPLPRGMLDVTVVASSPAGQVNLQDDGFTWFWKPLGMPQRASPAATLTWNFDFQRSDARHFNALDGVTRGFEYALDRKGLDEALADPIFRKTVVIPGVFSGGTTLQVGNATHIWVGAWNQIFADEVVVHEYGHHMQHANGTYQLWGTIHEGCYATVVGGFACAGRRAAPGTLDTAPDRGCWVNSAELAWFEGFPQYFMRVVMQWDAGRALTLTNRYGFSYRPGPGRSCPLVTSEHFNHHNARISGAFAEDYVQNALLDLRTADIREGGMRLTPEQIDRATFTLFFDRMRGAPTVHTFRTLFAERFPGSEAWNNLMGTYGM